MQHFSFRKVLAPALVAAALAVPAATASPATQPPPDIAKVPTAVGTGGAAATVDTLATAAAVDALRKGANAVDAAVVAAAVLGVTEPFSCGLGGGGFMVVRTADGEVTTIDGRETAPAAMRPDSFWEGGAPLPFNAARFSGLSAGVPGTVESWEVALRRYGTMKLREALRPAIGVARNGFVVDQTFFDQTLANVDFFDDVPSTEAIYLDPDGTPRDVGTVLRNPGMARAYERIAAKGANGFYRGAIAEAMVAAVQDPPIAADANHVWRPGVMTVRDVKRYDAPRRPPTHVSYRGLDVYGMGPPSSGGSTVGEALNILEGYPLATETRERQLHLLLEASRYSFADRGAYLGDEDYVDVPLRGLLSDGFAATRRALITETAAPGAVPPGDPWPFDSALSLLLAGASAAQEGESTTHLSVSDRWGNVV
ncbi:MAG: gamma-glutamyltransferase family protein, partial [Gaiellaceae bacterium]